MNKNYYEVSIVMKKTMFGANDDFDVAMVTK